MRRATDKINGVYVLISLIVIFGLLAGCKTGTGSSSSIDTFDEDDTAEASKLILDANDNLKRIRVLYHNSRAKYAEFLKALQDRDSEKVGKIAAEFSLLINDGYILAENAKLKISEAKEKNINLEWKEYLDLKETTLELQIKAFDFQRNSAELFGKEFGSDDKAQLDAAKRKFLQNKESFEKFMEEAKKKNKEANDLAKKAAERDAQMKVN